MPDMGGKKLTHRSPYQALPSSSNRISRLVAPQSSNPFRLLKFFRRLITTPERTNIRTLL
jgi:hypothetical protein